MRKLHHRKVIQRPLPIIRCAIFDNLLCIHAFHRFRDSGNLRILVGLLTSSGIHDNDTAVGERHSEDSDLDRVASLRDEVPEHDRAFQVPDVPRIRAYAIEVW